MERQLSDKFRLLEEPLLVEEGGCENKGLQLVKFCVDGRSLRQQTTKDPHLWTVLRGVGVLQCVFIC